jgi:hypothetical protein
MPFMNMGVTILYKKPNKKVRVNQERLHKRVSCRFHHACMNLEVTILYKKPNKKVSVNQERLQPNIKARGVYQNEGKYSRISQCPS